MRSLGILVALGLSGGIALAQQPPSPIADAKDLTVRPPADLLRRIEPELHAGGDWDDAFNAGDLEALLRLYAEDATLLPPDTPPLDGGRAALKIVLRHLLDKGLKNHKTTVKLSGTLDEGHDASRRIRPRPVADRVACLEQRGRHRQRHGGWAEPDRPEVNDEGGCATGARAGSAAPGEGR